MLSAILRHAPPSADSPALTSYMRADSNVLIPRDDQNYQDEFSFLTDDLYNDRSLASSIVRMVSTDPSLPPQVHLGNELPVKPPIQYPTRNEPRPVMESRMKECRYPEEEPELEPQEPDMNRERYPCSFMIVPPVNALVEFTRALTLEDSYLQAFNNNLYSSLIDLKQPLTRVSPEVSNKTEFLFTSVSDPIKITKHPLQRRFWKRNHLVGGGASSPYEAYRGFTGYVRRILKKPPGRSRARDRKTAIKQWVHTRNRIFWEHTHHRGSSSCKELSTS